MIDDDRKRAAESTVKALLHSLRRGTQALTNRDTIDRLRQLNEPQLHVVLQRLRRFKPEIAPAWGDDDIAVLTDVWLRLR